MRTEVPPDRERLMWAWNAYDKALCPAAVDFRYDRGVLSVPSNAAEIVIAATPIAFASHLTSPGYVTILFDAEEENSVRSASHFRVIEGSLADLLAECVDQLAEPVATTLGTPWRILNVRAWVTPPGTPPQQMYQLHTDGMPGSIFKIMIYFTPMDDEHGGLALEGNALVGPAGSWVLFQNSSIPHAGVPGRTQYRACAEITLSRAAHLDLELHQPGINAHWPMSP